MVGQEAENEVKSQAIVSNRTGCVEPHPRGQTVYAVLQHDTERLSHRPVSLVICNFYQRSHYALLTAGLRNKI